ncbi:HEAT repeat domain-containing protein [Verrucomicrobiota bacterium sgz303538]
MRCCTKGGVEDRMQKPDAVGQPPRLPRPHGKAVRGNRSRCPTGLTRILAVSAACVLFAFTPEVHSLEATPGAGLSLQQLEDFRAKGVPDDQWPALLETLGREDQKAAVRALIKGLEPFPKVRLAELLGHPKLAVRLGALDLLEDAAGETFGFDPWQDEPAAGANAEALTRWKSWVETGKAPTQAVTTLNSDTFRALALEIMSGNRERAERAMQRLEVHGFSAVAHIEAFLHNQPTLEPAARGALKNAEYRVVILQSLPKEAGALSRDLALGTPEAQSTALGALGEGGPAVLPVIAEMLVSPDPLVRETAVDAAFKAGHQHAVPIVVEHIEREKTESVLHAMLRGLGQYAANDAEIGAITRLLDHPAENVAISALDALAANQHGNVSDAVAKRLADSRWRVRAAALETIGKRNLNSLSTQVTERLHDPDLFVRVTAVGTLQRIAQGNATKLLVEEFQKQDDLKAPILRALFAGDKMPPNAVWEALWKAPPEIILQCLDTLEDRDDHRGARIPQAARFVNHPNRDVAASALRLLASRGRHSSLLLTALTSGDDARRDAVLDQLHLPPASLPAGATSPSSSNRSTAERTANPLLDRLYTLFRNATPKPATPPVVEAGSFPQEAQASPAEMRVVLERFLREGSPRQRFQAATVLTSQGDSKAAQFLVGTFDTLSSLDRRSVALSLENLSDWESGPIRELAAKLLRDPTDDVREKAIEAWLEGKKPERFAGLLAELSRPGSQLRPDDIYGYELDTLAQDTRARRIILDWARAVFADSSAPEQNRVLAIVLLGRSGQAKEGGVEQMLDAPRPWLRRAAYRALGTSAVQNRLDALLRDESAHVRAVIPFLASPDNNGWRHWFDDAHSVRDYEDIGGNRYSSRPSFGAWAQKNGGTSAAAPQLIAAVEKLGSDPSDLVRFEARFASLRMGRPTDPAALAGLLASQPADGDARERLGNYLESNFSRLGKSYGVLVPLVTGISPDNHQKLLKHFGLEGDKTFTSFAALSKLAPAPVDAGAAPDISVDERPTNVQPAAQKDFRVIFFFKPGCRDCARVRDMLQRHAAALPEMLIEEHNIDSSRDTLLNEALSARFQIKDTLHQATPAVFTQAGALIRDDITFPRLGDLLRKTATVAPDATWANVGTSEITTAAQTVTQRYAALSFGVVAAAGLLDGINPCAFATIIFLLSYLQVARRTPGEILAVGGAFIAAVFLAYFLVGLGLAQLLTQLSALRIAGTALNYLLAAFALLVAMLSFRDAQLATQGNLGEMTLQLPGMLKEQIRSVVRTGTRSTRFVAAAFGAGIVISFLELACTGQVYLPTIQYMLRAGHTSAAGHLLIYNSAFVVPLIIVFLLAWTGLKSESLIRFQKKHTAAVKVLTGVLFLLLAAFLIFGSSSLSGRLGS